MERFNPSYVFDYIYKILQNKLYPNNIPATLLCDFYKIVHKNFYPKGTEVIYSTLTPRSSKHGDNVKAVVLKGTQGFIKKYLIEYFNENFFYRPKEVVLAEYKRVIKHSLGVANPDTSHIAELHDLGYLPIKIKALREGTLVPIKVPMLTIENTDSRFFWLTNYLETLLSTQLWQATTSATKAYEFRKLLDKYAFETVGNTDYVDFQGHDFSMRGMSSLETAQLSGTGHLLSFKGTDTIPAISYLEQYYGANVETELVGSSVPATEHSIMSSLTPADGDRDEYEAYRDLITEAQPEGIISIVSDTYNLWKIIDDVLVRLKDEIINRNGKVVIRPDSGNPVDILCGRKLEYDAINYTSEDKGLIERLWEIFGGTINEKGYKVLDSHIGAIYGDSINMNNATEILERLKEKGFAASNIVFGLGSFFYQYNTRDTYGFAVKATYAQINGKEVMLMKDPVTDDGTKRSQRGRVVVLRNPITEEIEYKDGLNKLESDFYEDANLLEPVFENGKLLYEESLNTIRERLVNQK